jgi:hypothetical protein
MAEQKIVLRGGDSETINVGFKSINQLFSQERKFITHKRYEVTDSNHYTSFGISTLRAIKPSVSGVFEFTSTDLTQSSIYDGLSNVYQKSLWKSLNQVYFADDNRIKLYDTASVLSIPVYRYGFEIKPKSVNITNYYGSTTDYRYYTDEKVDNDWGKIVSSSVEYGYVFYRQGLVVMTNTGSNNQHTFLGDGNWDYSSNKGFVVNYKATKAVEEVSLLCHIGKDEFNVSTNPTSIISGSYNGTRAGFTTSSIFSPYITTIGLYNDDDELMAVAKLGGPLKKSTITDLFINVKFDID